MKLLLHACCGPCSLEPVRHLQLAGHGITLAYMNSNIHPAGEHERRLETLRAWARSEDIPLAVGPYDPQRWETEVALPAVRAQAEVSGDDPARERCRLCYRMRLDEAGAYAAEHGFDGIGTTLSVSPHQFNDLIRIELEAAAAKHGIVALFEDFRPFYPRATERSRALGMYRQDYCGCRFSLAEAEERRRERQVAKARRQEQNRQAEARQQAASEHRKAQRAEYDRKQAKKKRILKGLRAAKGSAAEQDSPPADYRHDR